MRRKTISLSRHTWMPALLLATALLVSCAQPPTDTNALIPAAAPFQCDNSSTSSPRSDFKIEPGALTQIATDVSQGAGKVIAAANGNSERPIIVFEETHTSRIGQLQIALMLYRLYAKHGLHQVSLEGAFADQRGLPTQWFHELTGTGDGKSTGTEIAVRLLREGEINSGEFISLALPQVQVQGSEKAEEYNVRAADPDPSGAYLLGIAEKILPPDTWLQVARLLKAKQNAAARKLLFDGDPWLKEHYEKLSGRTVASAEEMVTLYGELESKANQTGATVDEKDRTALRQQINFFQTATKRSCTMVKNTLAMSEAAPKSLVAMIVGAAHTNRVLDLLKAAKASFAVISPLAQNAPPDTAAGELGLSAYERKTKKKSVDPQGLLGAFLDGRHKPEPVVGERFFQIKSDSYFVTRLVALAAARGERPPFPGLADQFKLLRHIEIDPNSYRLIKKGTQTAVLFTFKAHPSEANPNQTVEIAAGGIYEPPGPPRPPGSHVIPPADENPDWDKLLEDNIKDELARKTKNTAEEKPPPKNKALPIKISTDVKAVFSNNITAVQKAI